MAINFDGFSAFARNTLAALKLSQSGTGVSDGSIPDVVPFVRYGGRPGDVSWSAVLPAVVWALFEQYGDLDTASEYFDALVALQRNVSGSAFEGTDLANLAPMFGEYGGGCVRWLAGRGGTRPLCSIAVALFILLTFAFALLARTHS